MTLEDLSRRLARQLATPLPERSWPGPELMAERARQIEALLGAGSIEVVDPRSLSAAIRRLQAGEDLTTSELRVCAFGAATPAIVDGQTVRIVSERSLTMLLRAQLEPSLRDPRRGRRFAYALAHAFMSDQRVPDDPSGTNLSMLGAGVVEWADAVPEGSFSTRSAAALKDLRRVFTDRETAQFHPYVVRGDLESVAPLRRLDVPRSSWVWRAAVLGGLREAAERSDAEFVRGLERYLTILQTHELLTDEGLGVVIDRLAGASDRRDRPVLRELLVARWGNPMAQSSRERWHTWTTERGRRLVVGWIAQRVIRSFFEVLAGPSADPARTAFWSRYAESIDEFWVYLGAQSRLRSQEAQRELRDAIGEGLSRLDHPSNNAFVMMIGNYAFVEFSETGNALFVYQRDALPIDLRRPSPRADDLKDQYDHVARITHQASWQDKATQVIGRLTQVWP